MVYGIRKWSYYSDLPGLKIHFIYQMITTDYFPLGVHKLGLKSCEGIG